VAVQLGITAFLTDTGMAPDELGRAVEERGFSSLWLPLVSLRAHAERVGRDPASLSVVPFGTLPDAGKLAYFSELGLTEVVLRVRNGPRDDMLRELDAHAQLAAAVA
jgi:hypothetical protein